MCEFVFVGYVIDDGIRLSVLVFEMRRNCVIGSEREYYKRVLRGFFDVLFYNLKWNFYINFFFKKYYILKFLYGLLYKNVIEMLEN